MNRDQALALVREMVKNPNLVKHHLAVEAAMGGLARHFGEDEATWGLVGLLHDADYELTEKDPMRHTVVTSQVLAERGAEPLVIRAIQSHSDEHGVPRESRLEKALYACDELTGLIVAATLVHPNRRLQEVDVPFVMKRFHTRGFAAGADRDRIRTCSELGFELEEFVAVVLAGMQEAHQELGL